MSEAAIERQCRLHALKRKVPSVKLQGSTAGDPDRIFLLPDGRFLLVEFKRPAGKRFGRKRPAGKLSPRQECRHAELLSCGVRVEVVYSTQQFRDLLDAQLAKRSP